MTNNLKSLLTRWKKLNYVFESTYKYIYCSNGIIPRAYGLPKVHKPGTNLSKLSCIESSLYSLATFLHNLIIENTPKSASYINNSFELINRLTDTQISDDFYLIALADIITVIKQILKVMV